MELPYNGRATIDENFNGLCITIPAKRNVFVFLFLAIWLCGWFFGEASALKEVISGASATGGPGLFIVVWLCGWTFGGIFAFSMFWWMLAGKEIITIGQGAITVDKKNAPFFKAKTYDLHEAKNFRAQEDYMRTGPFGQTTPRGFFGANSGTIKFDYGMETVKFGEGLDEAEANFILQKLRDKKLIS